MGKPGRPAAGLDDFLYWQERLKIREAIGMNVDEFCAEEGVSRSTYYRWVQALKDGIPEAVKQEGPAPTLAELNSAKFTPISVTSSPVEVELPNGGVVRLPVGVGEAVILAVIEAVGSLRARRISP